MKALALNASPRKTWNTATLLQHALDGAASAGAETELIHLGDLRFRGCVSCFACKRKGTALKGACALRDDLTPVLEKAMNCDVLFLGSPVYIGDVTGLLRCFLERFFFMNLTYNPGPAEFSGRTSGVGCVYTMNVTRERAGLYMPTFDVLDTFLRRFNWHVERVFSYDTWQFEDYSRYEAARFDVAHKERMRREQFPEDCAAASGMGERLAAAASARG